jgi:predicted acetyltransferase
MAIELIYPNVDYENAWIDIISEFESASEGIVPYALKCGMTDYHQYLKRTDEFSKGVNLDGKVRADTYFLIDTSNPLRILGAINIRYDLNEYLLNYGGNIGYGIRPTERRKGYATAMLSLALKICKDNGLKRVLITCDKVNIASAKTMISNGAIFENEVIHDGEIVQRYWIDIR